MGVLASKGAGFSYLSTSGNITFHLFFNRLRHSPCFVKTTIDNQLKLGMRDDMTTRFICWSHLWDPWLVVALCPHCGHFSSWDCCVDMTGQPRKKRHRAVAVAWIAILPLAERLFLGLRSMGRQGSFVCSAGRLTVHQKPWRFADGSMAQASHTVFADFDLTGRPE
jgi:hypothetical protein